MSVLHTLQIAPKQGTLKTLKDVEAFITSLSEEGFIDKEFAVFTGETEKIIGINSWDFMNDAIKSGLMKGSKLERVEDSGFKNLSGTKSYAFKVHLLKSKSCLSHLGVFTETDSQHFPLFIILSDKPVDFNVIKEDPETEEFEEKLIAGINCIMTSDGRNSRSLWDLAQNPHDFKEFYEKVNSFFVEYEIGSFYS